jgi:uncharacterized protein (TIGR02722 family)
MYNRRYIIGLLVISLASPFIFGCSAFRASTREVGVEEDVRYDAKYNYTDMRNVAGNVVDRIMASPLLEKESAPPVFMIAGLQNRTTDYVDMENLSDKMRTMLIQSGKVQFVNAAHRDKLLAEQGYQASNATPETQVAVGKQIGAKYMMTGSLAEMKQTTPKQVRVSKQELRYYKLTVEITDLKTGLIAWTTEEEFAREISKPLIGW